MTDYARILWARDTIGFSHAILPGQQVALRRFKQFPGMATVAGDFSNNYPVAVTFPNTLDRWGVAYPAGLVAVIARHSLPSPLSGGLTYNQMFESQLFGPDGGVPVFASGITYLVPGVLPATGYAANLHTSWERESNGNPLGYKIATNDSSSYYWQPRADWYGNFASTALFTATAVNIGSSVPGFRQVKIRLTYAGATIPTYTGSYVVTVSHNAAGGFTPLTGGDTVDGTASFADTAWSGVAGAWTTGYVDIGPCLPTTHGLLSSWVAKSDSSGVGVTGSYTGAATLFVALCPRLDIPLPMTVPGYGGLIAPGGTVV